MGIYEEQFEKGFQETVIYKKSMGNPNALYGYKTVEGYSLGPWQNHQRGLYKDGKLSSDRIKRLQEIGFTWNKREERFEKGFRETVLYKKSMRNPNTPQHYKTPEGYPLGPWQNRQRGFYKNGKLSPDRIKRLEKIGFTWSKLEEQFEKGFLETVIYKKSMGNPNAQYGHKTPEGYPLGPWQSRQRGVYKNGKLSPDRIKRLEKIGFTWELHDEQFEKGFRETVLYKKSMGNPNAPHGYKTPEGYRLGPWQNHQRWFYKNGKLSPDRIKRLEEIGFKWRMGR